MRKNKKWIIGVVTVVVILLSCTMLVAFTSADKDVQYIRTNYVDEMNGQTLVIESKEELDQYFNANKEKYNLGHKEKVYSDTTIGFEDAIVDYDEEWFKEHNLVLVLLTANSGSIRYKANNINIEDGTMTVSFNKKAPDMVTCDMAGWHIIIETEKVSIDEINVFVEGKEITK